MALTISRILHAGYVFECESTRIAFDPIFENPFSRNCHAFPSVRFDVDRIKTLRFSAVFISHYHDDHCSFESLSLLQRSTPIYLYCVFEEMFSLLRELGFDNVHPLHLNQPIQIGAIEITPRRALDEDVDSLFQIRAGGLKVLNVVDSWLGAETLAELAKQGTWDLVLWPFQPLREIEVLAPSRAQAARTPLPREWLDQLQLLNPRFIVPSSCQFRMEAWSWYNHAFFPITYREFETEVQNILPGSQVVRMNPSVSVRLDKSSLQFAAPLPWVQPVGDQDVDYEFVAGAKAPPTSEIAQRFSALTVEQAAAVDKYCRNEILERYASLDLTEDSYFHSPRIWKLAVFDHKGCSTNYFYQLTRLRLENFEGQCDPEVLSWLTEVPQAKLYAALYMGESLTSMYLRINDFRFEDAIEKLVHEANVVEDPLIRCLFSGVFASYQSAQLRSLTK